MVLTLGIISLAVNLMSMVGGAVVAPCCFGTLIPIGFAIPAWVMANTDIRLMREGRMDPSGLSTTSAGRVCAIISLAFSAIGLILAIAAVVFGAALLGIAAAASGSRP